MCRDADELRNEAFFTLVRAKVESVLKQLDALQGHPSEEDARRVNHVAQLAPKKQDFSCQTNSFADLYSDQEFLGQSLEYLQ